MRFDETYNLLDGHKTQTCRIPAFKFYEWYKDCNYRPKIIFAQSIDGEKRPIKLHFCTVMKLGYVRDKKYYEEGFEKPAEFEQVWRNIHGKFDPNIDVAVIEFDVMPRKGKVHENMVTNTT